MSTPPSDDIPLIDSILHPSDFSEASEVAFAHALKAALIARSRLTLFHVSADGDAEWTDFPGVRQTLERWGLLPPNSPRSAVPSLGIDVDKIIARERNPVSAVLRYLDTHPVDLIVLATHQHEAHTPWFRTSVAEPVARRSGQATLFVPAGMRGFVSVQDGSVSLQSILVPVARTPRAQPAVTAAARLVSRLARPAGTVTLLHVGATGDMPAVNTPDVPGWQWNRITTSGDVVEAILDTAQSRRADLVVMTTSGRDSFLDALRGSHSERILRRAPCPLLVIPEAD
ncbi:MAG: universal stress protein [Candidatus Rokuibacteriota bacterium]